jgi:ABC-type glycerol-3-phosphate transport system permease component
MLIPFQATIIPAYLITSWLGVLNSSLGVALPLLSTIICIFIFKASFEAVPRSLIDAARVDGLSEWRIIVRIMLPLSKSAIATNVILTFIWSWNAFLWPLIVLQKTRTFTLPVGVASLQNEFAVDYGLIFAGAAIAAVPMILFFLAFQRYFMEGVRMGALKG